jgi:hypothetical protein
VRYDAESLHAEFGVHFRLLESLRELHQTPFGTVQQFLYCHCLVERSILKPSHSQIRPRTIPLAG